METKELEHFFFNIKMLEYRINRLLIIDASDIKNKQEFQMVLDATLVLFRGLFLESPHLTKNLTFQNFFRCYGGSQYADKLDAFLDAPFAQWMTDSYGDKVGSIRSVLKFLTDKFVCHMDKVNVCDIALCNTIINFLINPAFENNIKHIAESIDKIVTVGMKTCNANMILEP